jgi:hypothetical protein
MTKRRRTDNTMTKRRTDNNKTERRRTENKKTKMVRALLLHYAGEDVHEIFDTLEGTGEDFAIAKQS